MANPINVTKKLFPKLWRALRTLDEDTGMEPLSLYRVPASHSHLVPHAEAGLKSMTDAELNDFLSGDYDVMRGIAGRDQARQRAHELLDSYYLNFEPGTLAPTEH